MMNRRKLICAGAAMLARVPSALAATYDLILKGGRVIDPSVGLDAIRDVAIAGGKIAAVEANIAGDATETVDVRGKIVAPGLIDIHTHAGRSREGPERDDPHRPIVLAAARRRANVEKALLEFRHILQSYLPALDIK
jgi:imidazolonepropionase-like amidohydrolase